MRRFLIWNGPDHQRWHLPHHRAQPSRLCRRAVHLERFNGDVYYNLALAELDLGERRNAIEIMRGGLVIEPEHKGLNELQGKICARKNPTMRFLSRDNVLNRVIGKLRSFNPAKKNAR